MEREKQKAEERERKRKLDEERVAREAEEKAARDEEERLAVERGELSPSRLTRSRFVCCVFSVCIEPECSVVQSFNN